MQLVEPQMDRNKGSSQTRRNKSPKMGSLILRQDIYLQQVDFRHTN